MPQSQSTAVQSSYRRTLAWLLAAVELIAFFILVATCKTHTCFLLSLYYSCAQLLCVLRCVTHLTCQVSYSWCLQIKIVAFASLFVATIPRNTSSAYIFLANQQPKQKRFNYKAIYKHHDKRNNIPTQYTPTSL